MMISVSLSLREKFALLPKEQREQWLDEQPTWVLQEIVEGAWWYMSRPEQIPPKGDWLVHLALSGRGWGKTRAGSEWLVESVVESPYDRYGTPTEWLIVAETLSDARLICVEGPAGILRVLDRKKIKYRYVKSPKPMVVFETGAKIFCEGADSSDVGRGYNAAGGWLDEIVKWKDPYAAWMEGIMPSMRADLVNGHPRVFVTTTPKPSKILFDWVKRTDGSVSIVRGSTFDNSANLSSHVVRELITRYDGTLIGRQELYGELLEALEGALFSRADIEKGRVVDLPDNIVSIAVGVDPNLTGEGDEFAIIVGARAKDNHIYILADRSTQKTGREAARRCWETVAEYGADLMVYESNLGKSFLEQVLRDIYFELVGEGLFPKGTTPPMKAIDSRLGKKTRAEPVANRYEQGRIHHVGRFEELERQLVEYIPNSGGESPDRLDGCVHVCRHFMAAEKRVLRMASPVDLDNLTPTGERSEYRLTYSDSFA
jgi:phage terminase large subunit-like protein